MKLNINTCAMLHEVEKRHGYSFLLRSTRVTQTELHRAMALEEIRQETLTRLEAWVKERIEEVSRDPRPVEFDEVRAKTQLEFLQRRNTL